MLVDSHCHLNFPKLTECLPDVLETMQKNSVSLALVIGVDRPSYPDIIQLTETHDYLYATVGVHPDNPEAEEFTLEELTQRAQHPKVVGIGETGLDYYWCKGDLKWQHQRFCTHIQAALDTGLPLVVHNREATADTLRFLKEMGIERGVMHCFTENWEVAKQVLDLGFDISFSGVVTFKNARQIQEVAQRLPLDRMLIETDSPFLAPVPYRGKLNQPGYVRYVADCIAQLRHQPFEEIAEATTANFFRLFTKVPQRCPLV